MACKLSWALPNLRKFGGRGKIWDRINLQRKYGLDRIEIPAHTIRENEAKKTNQKCGEILSKDSIKKLYTGIPSNQKNQLKCILHTECGDSNSKIRWNEKWWREKYFKFLVYLSEHLGGTICGIEIHPGIKKYSNFETLLDVARGLRQHEYFKGSKILIENRTKQIIRDADTFNKFFNFLKKSYIDNKEIGFVIDIPQLKTEIGDKNILKELEKIDSKSILGWHIHSHYKGEKGFVVHQPISEDKDDIPWNDLCANKLFFRKHWCLAEIFGEKFTETIDYIEKRVTQP